MKSNSINISNTTGTAVLIIFFLIFFNVNGTAQSSTGKNTTDVRISFCNMIDTAAMQLRETYKNSFGEEYTIRTFKYYISNISLVTAKSKIVLFPGVHLINEADSTTKTITIKAPAEDFTGISFHLGPDSIYNVSGTQTGDLDPAKGMFWTWNSGYIMAKLEATSPVSSAVNSNVSYHIGGFKPGVNTQRKITLPFPRTLRNTGSNEIVIAANANKWFDAKHTLKIAGDAVCATPGKLAVQFADNYAEMFTIASVK